LERAKLRRDPRVVRHGPRRGRELQRTLIAERAGAEEDAIDQATIFAGTDSVDLLTSISRRIDNQLWFVESDYASASVLR
jgi:hypothetical protein